MREIDVDPFGIKIMLPKAISHLVRIKSLPCFAANILKQEMLSLGGDVAVARGALTGRTKKTDCLLIGNLSQFNRLNAKLNKQPFGLSSLAKDLSKSIVSYQESRFELDLGRRRLRLGQGKTRIMGIINLTPDSFSGDGLYPPAGYNPNSAAQILDFAERMVRDGADIIDVGGESSRPGARPVAVKEELKRTLPVVKLLARRLRAPLSIDTYKPAVAKVALDNGAAIVNDITGLNDPEMIKLVAGYKAAAVIMHMKGKPSTMQKDPGYDSVIDEIIGCLDKASSRAISSGIASDKIIIDPGIGFGKTLEHNLEILKKLDDFKILGLPMLVGVSRKSFIGRILDAKAGERVFGGIAASVLAARNGAHILRAHDVKALKEALKVSDAILNS